MYDLHTHTYFSDGVLGPAELARRCQKIGYHGLAITDHCDHSNVEETLSFLKKFVKNCQQQYEGLSLMAGCEITHTPPGMIPDIVNRARKAGADIVLVHGETIVEPVAEGTNLAAIQASVDVLAHPGLITEEEVKLAAKNNVLLEISGRKGHCYTNGHVAALAKKYGAKLSFGSDGHAPGDYPTLEHARKILKGSGLGEDDIDKVMGNNAALFK
jgi:histidinol phosphatase-like PHP family hydrolase